MRILSSPSVPLALCIVALFACKQGGDDSSDESGDAPEESAETTETQGSTGVSVTGIPQGDLRPGPVYLAVKNSGIVKLDGGKSMVVQPLRYSVQDLVYGADGAIWVSEVTGVYRIQGAESKRVYESGGFQGLAVVSDQEAYAVNYRGLHHYANGTWSIEEKSRIGASLLRDVEIDRDGNTWVASSNALHEKKKGGSEWTEVDVSSELQGKPFFKQLEKAPDGTLYASVSRGLLKLEDGKWKRVEGDFGFSGTTELDVGPTGTVVALSGTKKIHVLSAQGKSTIDLKTNNLKASSIKQVAVDGSNRLWVATDNGLVLLDEKGKLLEHWPPATLPGVTGDISHIVVTGAGPSKLPRPQAPASGTVKGKVLKGGSPAAQADLELCNSPSMMFKTTPCEERQFKKTTKTSPAGDFSLPDVPIASYGFAVKPAGGKWVITLGSDCCSKMKQGQDYDVGAIKLK